MTRALINVCRFWSDVEKSPLQASCFSSVFCVNLAADDVVKAASLCRVTSAV